MTHVQLALIGFGNVGQALARLMLRKSEDLQNRYGITYAVTGIATNRHGIAIDPHGLPLETALHLAETGQSLASISKLKDTPRDMFAFLHACPADVLFENSPVNHTTGRPAADHLKTALDLGMHAITANKGPVVHAYRELTELARKQDRRFLFESAVMDGAPIFSLFREPLPAVDVTGFFGILNSCTNLILDRMSAGEDLEEAIDYAKSIGIAESDPSADVDGWDAAIKVAALATVVMGIPLLPQQVDRQGIRGIRPDQIKEAQDQGMRWKLVCRAERSGNSLTASVKPELVSSDSPLFTIRGTSSYVQFATDVLPGLGIVENNPSPDTTAYGLLADLINALRQEKDLG